MNSTLSLFRKVAVAEGISYIFLLFIAMPIKYIFHVKEFVKYGGWAHGILFIAYIAFLVMAWQEQKWKFSKAILIFLASLLPFAPFVVDRKLKDERPANVNNNS